MTILVAGLTALPADARRPRLFQRAVHAAFTLERRRGVGEVSVVFLPREKMRSINRRYLSSARDTDVIAFKHDAVPGIPSAQVPFGDIFVSGWMTRRQAREQGHSPLREALTLVAHGALHLLGYDDATSAQKDKMFRRQDAVLEEIGA